MATDALMQPDSRDAWFRLLGDGWTDAIRSRHPAGGVWTFWDYQAGGWQRDHGFRIDHLLLSPALADRLVDAGVDKDHRGREKASDHAPTWAVLDYRSEERRVGQECGSTCRYRWSGDH